MASKKKFNNDGIDVNIDYSYSGIAIKEYKKMRSIVDKIQSEKRATKSEMEELNQSLREILQCLKKEISLYRIYKDGVNKKEVNKILVIIGEAKATMRIAEYRYMLESDKKESVDRRRIFGEWAREDSSKKNSANNNIDELDVPIIDKDER